MNHEHMDRRSSSPILDIGAVFGDVDAGRTWRKHVSKVSMLAPLISAPGNDEIRVEVIYHADGRNLPLRFSGTRVSRYSASHAKIIVQVALPDDPTEDPQALLLSLLRKAVGEAEAFASRRNIAPALPTVRAALDKLQRLANETSSSMTQTDVEKNVEIGTRTRSKSPTRSGGSPKITALRAKRPETEEEWLDPSESLIQMLLQDIQDGESTYLIVERLADPSGMTYMQVMLQSDQTWLIEYQDGSLKRHWTTICSETATTCQLLTAWAFELDGWHDLAQWTSLAN